MENEKMDAPLDKVQTLLKEELSLTLRLYEQAEEQRKSLKENLNGKAVASATEAIEPTLRALDGCEKKKAALLSELGAENLADALGRMPYSQEKIRVRQYMKRLDGLLGKLREVVGTSRSLLANDMDYLTFSLNVMTAASASPAYGTPDAPTAATQGRKLLDKSR